MARLPETIRKRLIELARNNEGRVSPQSVSMAFTEAGYGASKMNYWLMQWVASGMIDKHYFKGSRHIQSFSFPETKHLLKETVQREITTKELVDDYILGVQA